MTYLAIRHLHITCAALSITLFALRGFLQLRGFAWRRSRLLRVLPHLNDAVLLAAAIALAVQSAQYPIARDWLTAKVLALVLYIGLGRLALREGAMPGRQLAAYLAALLTVAYIVAVALTRSPHLGALTSQ